jgi:hypothetical protein
MRKYEPPPAEFVGSAVHTTAMERLAARGISEPTRDEYLAAAAEVAGGREPPKIETAQERALRRARENAVADAAWTLLDREGGVKPGREAQERYRELLDRASKVAQVPYGRQS